MVGRIGVEGMESLNVKDVEEIFCGVIADFIVERPTPSIGRLGEFQCAQRGFDADSGHRFSPSFCHHPSL
jgi:hypothetical protein